MLIERLWLKNFMGYRSADFDFVGRPVIGVAGPNESGKSTLLQAISYGLYGKTRTDREVKLINDNTNNMVVCLAVRLGGEVLEIERGRTRKNEPILNVAGQGGKALEVRAYLAEKLRLDYSDFIALSYFVQGDLHQFMSGNKREYFQRWTKNLDYWIRLESAADNKGKAVRLKIDQLRYKIESLKVSKEKIAEWKYQLHAAKADIASAEKEAADIPEQISNLKADLANEDTLEALRRDIDGLKDDLRFVRGSITSTKTSIARANREAAQAHSGVCPVLDINCKRLMKGNLDRRTALKKEQTRLEKLLETATNKRHAIEATIKARQSDLDRLASTDNRRQTEAYLQAAQQRLNSANKAIREATQRFVHTKILLDRAKAVVKEIKGCKDQIVALESQKSDLLFAQFMCSKSGIPFDILSSELAVVEQRCNWVFERLDYHKRIRFSGYRGLTTFEKICPACGGDSWAKGSCRNCGLERPHKRKDEPTVTILDGAWERSFELESGGAQVLQSFAVRLASSLFVASMLQTPMEMILLDEVFAMLDVHNRQRLMELVIGKLRSEFGLKQQFVVSHHEDIINSVDDLIMVKQERGSSVARWA